MFSWNLFESNFVLKKKKSNLIFHKSNHTDQRMFLIIKRLNMVKKRNGHQLHDGFSESRTLLNLKIYQKFSSQIHLIIQKQNDLDVTKNQKFSFRSLDFNGDAFVQSVNSILQYTIVSLQRWKVQNFFFFFEIKL